MEGVGGGDDTQKEVGPRRNKQHIVMETHIDDDDDVIGPRASVSETARLCVAALISPSQSRHPCRLYELRRGTATATADDG